MSHPGYATMPIEVGEEFTIEQLLNLMLIPSGNTPANILAEYIAGSVDSFAAMMNTKAHELGCTNSHFTNPYGLHDEDHYSTASDLAIIARTAMQNEIFRSIVSKTSYSLSATNKYDKDDRVYTTTNELIVPNNTNRADNYYYKNAIGVKTGFTSYAKDCLVGAAARDGLEFICVILGGEETSSGLSERFLDARTLLDYGFDHYNIRKLKAKNDIVKDIEVKNATRNTKNLTLVVEDEINVLINKDDNEKIILPEIKLKEDLKAPIQEGEVVGTIEYVVEGISYETNLLASSEVKKSSFFLTILQILLIIFILIVISKFVKRKKRKNRRK